MSSHACSKVSPEHREELVPAARLSASIFNSRRIRSCPSKSNFGMRPRTALIESCPWLSRDEASEALRAAGGDLGRARELATAARRIASGVADEGQQRRKKRRKSPSSGLAANADDGGGFASAEDPGASGRQDGQCEGDEEEPGKKLDVTDSHGVEPSAFSDKSSEASKASKEASKKPAVSNPYAQKKEVCERSASATKEAGEIGRGDPADKSGGRESENGSSKMPAPAREPPRHSVSVNNLSDRQYCCVWSVEVYEDGYRPDVARSLLASVAR